MKQSEQEMRAVMDGTGLKYDFSDSGNARLMIADMGPNKDRTQLVFVQNFLDTTGPGSDYQDRDVYTVVADMAQIPKSFELMKKLLENMGNVVAGSLYVTAEKLCFRIDVPVTASAMHLRGAIFLCAKIADDFERLLTSGKDDF
jgi:hypothetical protein